MEVEMKIRGLMMDPITNMPIVILKETSGDGILPIWVGVYEANAIALEIEKVVTPRPMTHDLLRSVITTLGATVTRIVVSDLKNDTFFAKIVLQYNGTTLEVDARPSDAIALAVRADAPIFADDSVVEKAGVEMDQETGKPVVPSPAEQQKQPLREEELRSLSAFSEFIEKLDLDDLGQSGKKPPPKSV